jgi:trans-2-enoyl-CoA reductase
LGDCQINKKISHKVGGAQTAVKKSVAGKESISFDALDVFGSLAHEKKMKVQRKQ